MDVQAITMDEDEAARRVIAYEEELRRAGDSELEQVLRGFEALATGTPIINLHHSITMGGVLTETGLPRLAVARADKKKVVCRAYNRTGRRRRPESGVLYFDSYSENVGVPRNYDGLLIVRVPVSWDLIVDTYHSWTADVPMVPPHARRACGGKTSLREHLVLWEVEEWYRPRHTQAPAPYDPMLLRPIGGGMYGVVAQWDLTEVERAVIAGRHPN